MLRLSVRAADASLVTATVYPLVQRDDGRWVARGKAAVRVPALHLGRRVDANAGSGTHAATFAPAAASVPAGGPLLRTVHLSARLFEATAMKAVEQDLMDGGASLLP